MPRIDIQPAISQGRYLDVGSTPTTRFLILGKVMRFTEVEPICIGDGNEVGTDLACIVIGPIILYLEDAVALRDWLNKVIVE